MVVSGTLYTFPESFRAYKSRVAAELSGSKLNVVEVKADDKSRAHVPSFESTDKKVALFEANAIAYYVANEQLRGGASVEDHAQVLQWVGYGSTVVESAVASWVYPALSLVESTPHNVQRAKDDLKAVFKHLDEHLKTRTYFVGERVTLADIALAADLLLAYKHVADVAFRQPYVNVNRWFTTIVNQPQFKKIVGEVVLAEKAVEFCAKKHEEHKKNKDTAAAAKPAKEAKPPKEAKAKPAPKPVEKDDEEEEMDFASEEPKQNDPFAEMPKGTFNMDEFKRTYSNNDTATVALPYFWTNFADNKEFYSIYFCEYKYSNELTQIFMTSNLIGGMYQRIEKLRKNAFASMCVFGENNNNTIAGVWFWKGQGLPFPLCPDWTTDYESYEWRKLNPDDENDKKLVNNMFSWEGEVSGKKFNCGKIFK
jgi:elongation factor 1-gamma